MNDATTAYPGGSEVEGKENVLEEDEWVEETWHDPIGRGVSLTEEYYEDEFGEDEFGGDDFYEEEFYEVIEEEEELDDDNDLGSSAFMSDDFDIQALIKQQEEDTSEDVEMEPFELCLETPDEVSSLDDTISESSFVIEEMFVSTHHHRKNDENCGDHQKVAAQLEPTQPKFKKGADWDDDDGDGDYNASFAYDDIFISKPITNDDSNDIEFMEEEVMTTDDEMEMTVDEADDEDLHNVDKAKEGVETTKQHVVSTEDNSEDHAQKDEASIAVDDGIQSNVKSKNQSKKKKKKKKSTDKTSILSSDEELDAIESTTLTTTDKIAPEPQQGIATMNHDDGKSKSKTKKSSSSSKKQKVKDKNESSNANESETISFDGNVIEDSTNVNHRQTTTTTMDEMTSLSEAAVEVSKTKSKKSSKKKKNKEKTDDILLETDDDGILERTKNQPTDSDDDDTKIIHESKGTATLPTGEENSTDIDSQHESKASSKLKKSSKKKKKSKHKVDMHLEGEDSERHSDLHDKDEQKRNGEDENNEYPSRNQLSKSKSKEKGDTAGAECLVTSKGKDNDDRETKAKHSTNKKSKSKKLKSNKAKKSPEGIEEKMEDVEVESEDHAATSSIDILDDVDKKDKEAEEEKDQADDGVLSLTHDDEDPPQKKESTSTSNEESTSSSGIKNETIASTTSKYQRNQISSTKPSQADSIQEEGVASEKMSLDKDEDSKEELFYTDVDGNFWGRTKEMEGLETAFNMIDKSGVANVPRVAWVHGNNGIGKTKLCKEFLRRNANACLTCYGCFEENMDATKPFCAIVDCLSELVRHLTNDESTSDWTGKIRGCLGSDSRLLATFIPDLAAFLGVVAWTKLPEFDMTTRRLYDRLRFAARRFIWLVCQYHKVVLVLDDMQWISQDTAAFVESLLSLRGVRFFFVGVHRGIKNTHTLQKLKGLLRPLCTANTMLEYMKLNDTVKLVAGYLNTLAPTNLDGNIMKLSQLLFGRCDGNPLPLINSIHYLYSKGLLTPSEDGWTWNADQILTESVVSSNSMDLAIERLKLLDSSELLVLKAASFLGPRSFRIDPLWQSVMACFRSQKKMKTDVCPLDSAAEIEPILDSLIAHSLIEKVSTRLYQFTHDTIRKAGVSLLPEGTKKRQILHLNLASGLASLRVTESYNKMPLEKEELKFLLVEHYGAAINHLRTEKEKELYAKLSLELAEVKMAKAAILPAIRNLQSGLGVLDESNGWELCNGLTVKLHLAYARLNFCLGGLGDALGFCDDIIKHATSDRDKLEAWEIIVFIFMAKGDLDGAYNAAISALKDYFDADLDESVEETVSRVRAQLGGFTNDNIIRLPKMTHKKAASNVRFLSLLAEISSLRRDYATQDIAALRMVEFTLLYGSSVYTSLSFSLYGVCLIRRGLFVEAYRFGHLAELMSSLEDKNDVLAVGLHHSLLHYWRKSAKSSLPSLMNVSRSAINSNDMEHLPIFVGGYFSSLLVSGAPLHSGDSMFQSFQSHRAVFGARDAWLATLPFQTILKLRGRFDGIIDLNGLSGVTNDTNAQTMGTQQALFFRIVVAVFFQDHENALKLKEKLLLRPTGILLPYQAFIEGLIATYFVRCTSSHKERHNHQRKASKIIDVLQSWGKKGMRDAAHMTYILSTELHVAIKKDLSPTKASSLYETAMEAAEKQGCFHHSALASERAGVHFLAINEPKFARKHLSKAYELYREWGANGKVEHLERQYSEYITAPTTMEDETFFQPPEPEGQRMHRGGRSPGRGRMSGRRPMGQRGRRGGRPSPYYANRVPPPRTRGCPSSPPPGGARFPNNPGSMRSPPPTGPGRGRVRGGRGRVRPPPPRVGHFQNNTSSMRSLTPNSPTNIQSSPKTAMNDGDDADNDVFARPTPTHPPARPPVVGPGRGRMRPPPPRGISGSGRGRSFRNGPGSKRLLMDADDDDDDADADDDVFARPTPTRPPARPPFVGSGRGRMRPPPPRGISGSGRGRSFRNGPGSKRLLMDGTPTDMNDADDGVFARPTPTPFVGPGRGRMRPPPARGISVSGRGQSFRNGPGSKRSLMDGTPTDTQGFLVVPSNDDNNASGVGGVSKPTPLVRAGSGRGRGPPRGRGRGRGPPRGENNQNINPASMRSLLPDTPNEIQSSSAVASDDNVDKVTEQEEASESHKHEKKPKSSFLKKLKFKKGSKKVKDKESVSLSEDDDEIEDEAIGAVGAEDDKGEEEDVTDGDADDGYEQEAQQTEEKKSKSKILKKFKFKKGAKNSSNEDLTED